MTDPAALGEAYRDLTEIDRRREGTRFSATLPDGMPVVALVIAPDVGALVSSHDHFAAAFQRAASVHHEAIVPPVAWGTLGDGTLHCAYARLEADPLLPGSVPPAAVARIGMQIARALTTTHQSGLVHGAINTSKIVMTHARGAQLNDFGLFSALSEGGLGPQGAAVLLNDAPYSSPEAQLGHTADERADIYSLGAALYELLTGKPPYGGRTTTYVLASVLSEEAEESKDDLPSPVVAALLRAIERAPEDRWPTAAAFAAALAAGAMSGEAPESAIRRRSGCLPAAAASVAAAMAAGLLGVIVRG
jgi:serine/threonine protein kinase